MIKREHLTYWYPMVAVAWEKKDDKSGVTRQSNRNNDDLGYPILRLQCDSGRVTSIVSNIGNHSQIPGPFIYHQLLDCSFGPT
jgi:hypothetical protein